MDNVSDTLFHLPGWYWYLENEKDIRELNRHQAENFLQVFLRIMYKEFRVMGYHEFESKCLKIIHSGNEPYIKWFYNRQPIIQVTQKPISTNHSHVTIPLQREPASEIQMDILQLNEHFFNVNYHIKYLVVAVDIYSRFVWLYPVKALDVDRVTNALLRAFSRPGISEQYFHKIRNQVHTITVDGGSEFKKEFPNSLKSIFPNSQLIVSEPKSKTFGRPTTTGPIEASIRMIRKLLRDYGLSNQTNLLEPQSKNQIPQIGLTRVINSNNSMRRAVLNGQSPNQVAFNIIHKNSTAALTAHMKKFRKKQLLKKANLQTLTYPIIKSKHDDYAYRFYLPPKQFVKEVDFRVSLETYYIKEYTSSSVVLCNCENENETKNTTWHSLVLVKKPFPDAPNMAQLKKFYKQEEKENAVEMVPVNLIEPYTISQTIKDAIGEDHAAIKAHPGRVLRRSPRFQQEEE
jgi:hypothetical protein